jgi:predicted esterase
LILWQIAAFLIFLGKMTTNKQYIKVSKTAKVVTYGNLSEQTKIVWLVAHGYGFLAERFIKRFSHLDENEHFVIVPEALNRFYLNGFSGKAGANWMTTEEREYEIADYIQYLDNVYETFNLHKQANLVVLGFSQGGSTVARWFQKTHHPIKTLVFWGASIPDEVLEDTKIHTANIFTLVGSEDEFITKERLDIILKNYNNVNLKFSHIFYKGGHDILTQPLMQLISQLNIA